MVLNLFIIPKNVGWLLRSPSSLCPLNHNIAPSGSVHRGCGLHWKPFGVKPNTFVNIIHCYLFHSQLVHNFIIHDGFQSHRRTWHSWLELNETTIYFWWSNSLFYFLQIFFCSACHLSSQPLSLSAYNNSVINTDSVSDFMETLLWKISIYERTIIYLFISFWFLLYVHFAQLTL